MDLLEQFVRRCAKHSRMNGEPMLITDHDPLVVAGFAALGWTDPHPEHLSRVQPKAVVSEAAMLKGPTAR